MIVKISSISGMDMQINYVKLDTAHLGGRVFILGQKGVEYPNWLREEWHFEASTNGTTITDEFGNVYTKPLSAKEKEVFDALTDVLPL